MIEERITVAMDLLKQKSLKEWVGLCETAHGKNFKESVLACFAVPPSQSPRDSEEWIDEPLVPQTNVARSQPPASVPPVPISSGLQQVPASRKLQRGNTQEVDYEPGFEAAGESTFTSSSPGEHRTVQHTSPGSQAKMPSSSQSLSGRSPTQPSPPATGFFDYSSDAQGRGPATGAKGKPVFVIPSPRRTDDKPENDNLESRMLLSRSPRQTQSQGFGSKSERPRTVQGGFGRRTASPRDAASSLPVQIMFSNNAISGSSWEASASLTPPRTPPRTPTTTEKDLK